MKKLLEKIGRNVDESELSQIEYATDAHYREEMIVHRPFDFIEIEVVHLDNISDEPKYDIGKMFY